MVLSEVPQRWELCGCSWQSSTDLHSLQRRFGEGFVKGLGEGVVGALELPHSHANNPLLVLLAGKGGSYCSILKGKGFAFKQFLYSPSSAFLQIFVFSLKICVFFVCVSALSTVQCKQNLLGEQKACAAA